jgi:dienelactone hydrolase
MTAAHRRLISAALVVAALACAVPQISAGGARSGPPFAVGLRITTFVDRSRVVRLPSGATEPRRLVTYLRYPTPGRATDRDLVGARPDRAAGSFPLVVFGHGFAVTPATYARLLRAWARAGYVVAAPVFPLGNANAPGGPNESDLINQPADLSFVVSRLLAADSDPRSPLHGLIDPTRIAVAGHSDGADTALAAAYSRRFRDSRLRAAMILSGAEIPGVGGYVFHPGMPPLLAVQGTADTLNPPGLTAAFFAIASRPKFLLTLPGAPHLAPYTWLEPQLTVVEDVTIGFLDHYLKHGPLPRLPTSGAAARVARLSADP